MDEVNEYEELKYAVHRALDDMYVADVTGARVPWPLELEQLTGWEEPDMNVMEE